MESEEEEEYEGFSFFSFSECYLILEMKFMLRFWMNGMGRSFACESE